MSEQPSFPIPETARAESNNRALHCYFPRRCGDRRVRPPEVTKLASEDWQTLPISRSLL